jgi:hypothetical protein
MLQPTLKLWRDKMAVKTDFPSWVWREKQPAYAKWLRRGKQQKGTFWGWTLAAVVILA